jgi:hypothetical protein
MGRPKKKSTDYCKHHGLTAYYGDGRQSRCKRCNAERIVRKRVERKVFLIQMFGGGCALCGYQRCAGALKFHHVDPETKLFSLGSGVTRSKDRDIAEAKKCLLLCGNCHDECHAGMHEQTLLESLLADSLQRLES